MVYILLNWIFEHKIIIQIKAVNIWIFNPIDFILSIENKVIIPTQKFVYLSFSSITVLEFYGNWKIYLELF